ncbi:MAG: hypothetical protein WDN04_14745 [Rhodospirillales bacterium]
MRIPIPTAPGRALAGNAGHLPPTFQLPFKPAPAGKQAFTPPPAPNGTAIEDAESTPEPAATPAELYELALTSAAMGFHQTAIDRLREATQRAPDHAAPGASWRSWCFWQGWMKNRKRRAPPPIGSAMMPGNGRGQPASARRRK